MENQQLSRIKLAVILFGVFISSFGVLAFEISLTRIFSIMLDYHYTFLVISLAVFGLGLGGVIAQRLSRKSSLNNSLGKIAILSVSFASLVSVFALVAVSFSNLHWIAQTFIIFLPFLAAGTLLAMVYKLFVRHSSTLYFADLLGAGAGALAIVFLLNGVGAIVSVLLVSFITLVGASFFALASRKKFVVAIAVLAIVVMGVFVQFSVNSSWIVQPASDQGKELSFFLSDPSMNAKIVDSRWSSFGQTDLVDSATTPHEKVIFVDGGAGTKLFHFNGDFSSSDSTVPELKNSTQYFPYYVANNGSSLVIGPGGGLDVLTALMRGVDHIYAVEVNPSIVSIVKDYSDYTGGIYTDYDNVHVNVDEGRSFLKRSNQKYDNIVLDIPITKTSQGTFGYALAENYLFTTESFTDYLNHLSDDGFLTVVAHNQAEIYKLTSTAFKVLGDQGLNPQEIMKRIAVIGSTGHEHSALPVFMLKKTAINETQAAFISVKADEAGFATLYTPLTLYSNVDETSIDPILASLAKGGEISNDALFAQAPYNIEAPTDDKPFFYNFQIGVPSTLIVLLAGTIGLGITVSIFYVAGRRREEVIFTQGTRTLLKSKFSSFKWYCFASLGFGFMLIEVALNQKFVLFLGEPTLAIAVSLFSLLIAAGLGSIFSRRWSKNKQYKAFSVSLAIAAIAIAYMFILTPILNSALSYSTPLRFLTAFMLILPIGFLMGIPFPTLLSYIKQEAENDTAWLWCINGAFSVVAGSLAIVVAMTYGFNAVLLLGAITYAALFFMGRMHEQNNRVGQIKWVNPHTRQYKRA